LIRFDPVTIIVLLNADVPGKSSPRTFAPFPPRIVMFSDSAIPITLMPFSFFFSVQLELIAMVEWLFGDTFPVRTVPEISTSPRLPADALKKDCNAAVLSVVPSPTTPYVVARTS